MKNRITTTYPVAEMTSFSAFTGKDRRRNTPHWLCAVLILLTGLASCSSPDNSNASGHSSGMMHIAGYVVPPDSLATPVSIGADSSLFRRFVLSGEHVPAFANTELLNPPNEIHSLASERVEIGSDGVPEPVTIVITPRVIPVKAPKLVKVRDPGSRDRNPFNFTYINKLQGLKHNAIRCVIEDHTGALWIGTDGGGISRYDGLYLMHYAGEEGLPSLNVTDMIEAKDGTLWMITFRGLVHFDGSRFYHYSAESGLPSERLTQLFEDSQGYIWCGTANGGAWMIRNDSLTQFGREHGLPPLISSFAEDAAGGMWIGSQDGLHLYHQGTFHHFRFPAVALSGNVRTLQFDRNGRLWFGSASGGLFRTRENIVGVYASSEPGETLDILNFKSSRGPEYDQVRVLHIDDEDNLYFGVWLHGMCRMRAGVDAPNHLLVERFESLHGLPDLSLHRMTADRHGQLWIASSGCGLVKHNPGAFIHYTTEEGLLGNYAYGLAEDSAGALWIATSDGGLNRLDSTGFLRFSGSAGRLITSLNWASQTKDGTLWFGTYDAGALSVRRLPGIPERFDFTQVGLQEGLFNRISAVFEDDSGRLWFTSDQSGAACFHDGHFEHYTKQNGLSGIEVGCITQDRRGRIWLGSYDGGITIYDPSLKGRPGAFVHIGKDQGLPDPMVICIHEDCNGDMWAGTPAGVMRFSPVAGEAHAWKAQQFTEADGLVNNVILSMLEDRDGHMWFGTRFGVSKTNYNICETSNEQISGIPFFTSFTYEDGFQAVGCLSNAMTQRDDGSIWIGGNGRLSMLPNHLITRQDDKLAPAISITGIDIFNERVHWDQMLRGDQEKAAAKDTSFLLANGVGMEDFRFSDLSPLFGLPQQLSLTHDNNHITFQFSVITMDQPHKVKYQYFLEGFDEQWSGLSSMTSAPYGNLPHGHYTLRVKAMSSRGLWSPEASYAFTIRPPWWKTWWFRVITIMLLMIAAVAYVKWREWGLLQTQRQLEHQVADRTSELVAEKQEVERQRMRSDELLLNILPEQVAEELKAKGEAEAVLIEQVTVLFTDFKGFTAMSAAMSPKDLVRDLHECFSAFDHIIEKHGLEKIKTIGDAYMAAGGLPTPNNTHASDAVHAALEMAAFIEEGKRRKIEAGLHFFEIRIGIHTGPVVAGIVGVKKFQYDIWGDTVNTASRMESSGEAGKINISESTRALIGDQFHCTPRGRVHVKGKGELEMFFVEGKSGTPVTDSK